MRGGKRFNFPGARSTLERAAARLNLKRPASTDDPFYFFLLLLQCVSLPIFLAALDSNSRPRSVSNTRRECGFCQGGARSQTSRSRARERTRGSRIGFKKGTRCVTICAQRAPAIHQSAHST